MEKLTIGIITISDRAYTGQYEDKSSEQIRNFIAKNIKNPFLEEYILVPDNEDDIKKSLIELSDKKSCHFILTTGGTGPSPRDITPEATLKVVSRLLPGFGEAMRMQSLKTTPTAILSRQIAGIRRNTLIVNLPGNPAAINLCLEIIFPAIADCIKLISNVEIHSDNQNIKHNH